jgi:phosphoribosylformylglycinamidine cyclo-ligase
MSSACQDAGCALIGGETAQLPGIYRESTYDLAGFIVGSVEQDRIIDGSAIKPGHVLVGFASNGLHTNGYSLARAVFGLTDADAASIRERLGQQLAGLGETLGEALLRPHMSYLPVISRCLESFPLAGLAHVTGGGIAGNLERIIPDGATAVVDACSWIAPAIFPLIQEHGDVRASEMFQVFNMGIGFIAVADEPTGQAITNREPGAAIIGSIEAADSSSHRVVLSGIDS